MPSPFPGLDPYIERQDWPGFHLQLMAELQRALAPLLRPKYRAVLEQHLYLTWPPEERTRPVRPDALVAESAPGTERGGPADVAAAREIIGAPVTLLLPQPEMDRQAYLELRQRDTGRVVTVLELLSPGNKQPGPHGRDYLSKREAVLDSDVHLVELDLLRGGQRLPMADPLPEAEYYVLVSRAEQRPACGVWPIGLRDRLPGIPIPLTGADPDVALDLQELFGRVYDATGLQDLLDYRGDPEPPLRPEDATWAAERLQAAGLL